MSFWDGFWVAAGKAGWNLAVLLALIVLFFGIYVVVYFQEWLSAKRRR